MRLKKRLLASLLAIAMVFTIMPMFSQEAEATSKVIPAEITRVTISPSIVTVQKGTTQDFKATVSGTGDFNKDVTWSIVQSGKHADTTISSAGVLSISANETLNMIEVKATSDGNDTKTATAVVTITDESVTKYALTVIGGTGSGQYAHMTTVDIIANEAPAGQRFVNWTSDNGGILGNATNATTIFTMPNNAVTVTANYENIPVVNHMVTASAGANGTISPSGEKSVSEGSNITFTFTPDAGYEVDTVTVDGSAVTPVNNQYTITNVQKAMTINVTFKQIQHTVTASAGANGSISPVGSVNVAHGTDKAFTFTPNAGYEVDKVTVDGSAVIPTNNQYTITDVQKAMAIHVTFKAVAVVPTTYDVTVNASYATNSGASKYAKDVTVTINAGSRSGYTFSGWTVNSGGAILANANSVTTTFEMPDNAVTVTANWTQNTVPPVPPVKDPVEDAKDAIDQIPNIDSIPDGDTEALEKAKDAVEDAIEKVQDLTDEQKAQLSEEYIEKLEQAYVDVNYRLTGKLQIMNIMIGVEASGAMPLDANGNPIPVKLEVTEITNPTDLTGEAFVGMTEKADFVLAFDVSLEANGVSIQPDGSITITFSAPDRIGDTLTVAHKLQNGDWEYHTATVGTDGNFSVTVTELSPFIVLANEGLIATAVTLDKTSISLQAGQSATLTATVSPNTAVGEGVWSSSDTAVASVDASGNVTGIAVGSARITYTFGNVSATATVTVTSATSPETGDNSNIALWVMIALVGAAGIAVLMRKRFAK